MPTKTWADGDNLPASDLNTYLRDQVVTSCTAGSRPSTSVDGRPIFETDTRRILVWDSGSSAWQNGPWLGSWTTWTPVITQGVTPTLSVADARYCRVGRLVTTQVAIVFGSAGTAGAQISTTLPVAARYGSANMACGSWWYVVGSTFLVGTAMLSSGSSALFIGNGSSNALGPSPTVTIAAAESFTYQLTYEAASG